MERCYLNRPCASLLVFILFLSPIIHASQCPPPPSNELCVEVDSYDAVREIISSAFSQTRIVFCPFEVVKNASEPPIFIFNRTGVEVLCMKNSTESCKIKGEGSHIKFAGLQAEGTVQGFTFEGASKNAVTINKDATLFEQKFCDVSFIRNKSSQGGSALKINRGSSALVQGCEFISNDSERDGAGISNRGNLRAYSSIFIDNYAESGSAIMTKLGGKMEVKSNFFEANIARDAGPAINWEGQYTDEEIDEVLKQNKFVSNSAATVGNGDCNGIYTGADETCHEHNDLDTQSFPDPSNHPTYSPSNSPSLLQTNDPSVLSVTEHPSFILSNLPSQAHTKAPSQYPSTAPSSHPSLGPSPAPSSAPSLVPSLSPIVVPSHSPSLMPSKHPSSNPSPEPTEELVLLSTTASPSLVHQTVGEVVPMAVLTFKGWSRNESHGICEGDCDRDADCAEGLVCFHREGYEEVPGCAGEGKEEADYCIPDPSLGQQTVPTTPPTLVPTSSPSHAPSAEPVMPTSSPTSAPSAEPLMPTSTPTSAPDTSTLTRFDNVHDGTPSEHDPVCPLSPPSGQSCIVIDSYNQFRDIVMGASPGDKLVFCGFNVIKTEDDKPTVIKSNLQLVCANSACTIVGGGSQIGIQGSKVLIQGFTFRGATSIAVRVYKKASDELKICDCVFASNESKRRGAALKIEDGNEVTVGNCKFEDNVSEQQGGGIYNEGKTRVIGSRFHRNQAQLGAAIFSGNDSIILELKSNNFIENIARSRGPSLYLDEDSRAEIVDDNTGSGNVSKRSEKFSCDGVYREISMSCRDF